MNRRKDELPQGNGARRWPGLQTGHPQPHKPGIMQPKKLVPQSAHKPTALQPKTSAAPQTRQVPTAPPAYRPQPVPKVLQTKMSALHQPITQPGRVGNKPGAPAAYRPQPAFKVAQPKTPSGQQPHASKATPQPVAPPAYRPQRTPRVLQTKTSQTGSHVARQNNRTAFNERRPSNNQPPRTPPQRPEPRNSSPVSRSASGFSPASSRIVQCKHIDAGAHGLTDMGSANRTTALNYSDRGGKKTLDYPMKLYELFLGHFIDKKTAINAESRKLEQFANLVGPTTLAKGVRMVKSKKEAAEYTDGDGMGWLTEPNAMLWPFVLRIKSRYGLELVRKNEYQYGVTPREILVQFAQDKYGYVIGTTDKSGSYSMVAPNVMPAPNQYSSMHAVEPDRDLWLRSLISQDSSDIDDSTKIIAEGARWKAVAEIAKSGILRDTTRFYPTSKANGGAWDALDDVPFVELGKLWISWNKFNRKWGATNQELKTKILDGSVNSGKTWWMFVVAEEGVETGDGLIVAVN